MLKEEVVTPEVVEAGDAAGKGAKNVNWTTEDLASRATDQSCVGPGAYPVQTSLYSWET